MNPEEIQTEVNKQKLEGFEKIQRRKRELAQLWKGLFPKLTRPFLKKGLEEIGALYADLDNDFDYVKELNTSMAMRYEEVWDCLPTMEEMDALIKLVEKTPYQRSTFFRQDDRSVRIKKLKKLRSGIKASLGR